MKLKQYINYLDLPSRLDLSIKDIKREAKQIATEKGTSPVDVCKVFISLSDGFDHDHVFPATRATYDLSARFSMDTSTAIQMLIKAAHPFTSA